MSIAQTFAKIRDSWTRCGGYCNLASFDAADAYTQYGPNEDAMELASRCYHKSRPMYPDEHVSPLACSRCDATACVCRCHQEPA